MSNNNKLAIAAFVLGMISCVCFCLSALTFPPVFGLVAGVAGLLLAINARKRGPNSTVAFVALALSCVGLALCAVTTVTCTVCMNCSACSSCSVYARLAQYF